MNDYGTSYQRMDMSIPFKRAIDDQSERRTPLSNKYLNETPYIPRSQINNIFNRQEMNNKVYLEGLNAKAYVRRDSSDGNPANFSIFTDDYKDAEKLQKEREDEEGLYFHQKNKSMKEKTNNGNTLKKSEIYGGINDNVIPEKSKLSSNDIKTNNAADELLGMRELLQRGL